MIKDNVIANHGNLLMQNWQNVNIDILENFY